MDETGTLPSAGSSRFRFNGFANLASQHDKSAHPEVKRFLTGKEEQRNWIYPRDEKHLNEVAKKPGQFPARANGVDYAVRSKRSAFMTLVHVATKSRTNFSWLSS